MKPWQSNALVATLLFAAFWGGACAVFLASPSVGATNNPGTATNEDSDGHDGDTLTFRLASELVDAGGVQLSNGIVVTRTDWDALLFAPIWLRKDNDGKDVFGHCTATLIGPQTALLAAHCVDGRDRIRQVRLEISGRQPIELVCAIPREYTAQPHLGRTPRSSEDYALCHLSAPIPTLRDGFLYEAIALDRPLKPQEAVLLTGYGCTNLSFNRCQLVNTAADGLLRIGDEQIETGSSARSSYAVLRSSLGREPVLCPGDSGGPLMTGVSIGNEGSRSRIVRAVNSSIEPVTPGTSVRSVCAQAMPDILSRVADLGSPSFKRFLQTWMSGRPPSDYVCGFNVAKGERQCR